MELPERIAWAVIGIAAMGVILFGTASLLQGIAAVMVVR